MTYHGLFFEASQQDQHAKLAPERYPRIGALYLIVELTDKRTTRAL